LNKGIVYIFISPN